ncbi:Coenzyme F420 hydrogenase/dehydrogenase, beta subunit C-terminal domain [Alistipes putredinis]|jgi:coenzyme F420-reducing hydrogenase beta subunit|uniref:Coenzyme F420 hydrogenase/dehydrogenase, beta subunit C-terminal domain n=1 Tax=Alistipes putredinis TaxID=28117 RepID=UPI003A836908
MEHICLPDLCTGCSACFNICSHDAISMESDLNGVLRPLINPLLCVNCTLCQCVCPVNNKLDMHSPMRCYAGWNEDKEYKKECASGGIASLLYLYVIEHLKGVVYGVGWDDALRPVYKRVENSEEVNQLKGSKYVQAFVGKAYRWVKTDLHNNRTVFFVGTPCQIAGLKGYLRKDYANLITCDLLCHGVPPYEYLKSEISRILRRKSKTVTNCRFRGNDEYNYGLSLWNGERLIYFKKGIASLYLSGFLTSIILRESCYSCKFSTNERVADITIGDFLGLGSLKTIKPRPQNISVITLNTSRALLVWDVVKKYQPNLKSEQRPIEEAIKGGVSFRHAAIRNLKRDAFLKDYQCKGWNYAIRKALWKNILRNKLRAILKLKA